MATGTQLSLINCNMTTNDNKDGAGLLLMLRRCCVFSFNLSEECDGLRVKCAGNVADIHQLRCSFEQQNEGGSSSSLVLSSW